MMNDECSKECKGEQQCRWDIATEANAGSLKSDERCNGGHAHGRDDRNSDLLRVTHGNGQTHACQPTPKAAAEWTRSLGCNESILALGLLARLGHGVEALLVGL